MDSPVRATAPRGRPLNQQFYFFSPAGDGSEDFESEKQETLSWWKLCLLGWCPCFVGNPCSFERREEYQKAMRSFCFLISVVDIIMMIVAFALPPHIVPFTENPAIGPGGSTFLELGGMLACRVRYQGQFWRFFTPMFLHSGILHVLFNLMAQLRIGIYLEHKWGWMKLVSIYFLAGIGGALADAIIRPNLVSVGASAALMGVIGAYLAEIIAHWERMEENQRKMALFQVLVIILVTMLLGFAPFIDTSSHVGGLIFGFLAGAYYFGNEFASERLRRAVPLGSLFLILLLLSSGFAFFYTLLSVNNLCNL